MRRLILIITLIIIATSINLYGQKCSKKKYSKKEDLSDFDYRSQSTFTELASGDTLHVKIVVYSKQEYRIIPCGDPKLGKIRMKVISPEKRIKRKIKKIQPNANNPSKNDTLWTSKVVTTNTVVFNNATNNDRFWQFPAKNTRLLILEITAPEGKKDYSGCINTLVGHKLIRSANRKLR